MENGSALRSKGPFPMTYDELEERFPQLIQDVPCFDFLICMKELPPGRPVAADQWVPYRRVAQQTVQHVVRPSYASDAVYVDSDSSQHGIHIVADSRYGDRYDVIYQTYLQEGRRFVKQGRFVDAYVANVMGNWLLTQPKATRLTASAARRFLETLSTGVCHRTHALECFQYGIAITPPIMPAVPAHAAMLKHWLTTYREHVQRDPYRIVLAGTLYTGCATLYVEVVCLANLVENDTNEYERVTRDWTLVANGTVEQGICFRRSLSSLVPQTPFINIAARDDVRTRIVTTVSEELFQRMFAFQKNNVGEIYGGHIDDEAFWRHKLCEPGIFHILIECATSGDVVALASCELCVIPIAVRECMRADRSCVLAQVGVDGADPDSAHNDAHDPQWTSPPRPWIATFLPLRAPRAPHPRVGRIASVWQCVFADGHVRRGCHVLEDKPGNHVDECVLCDVAAYIDALALRKFVCRAHVRRASFRVVMPSESIVSGRDASCLASTGTNNNG